MRRLGSNYGLIDSFVQPFVKIANNYSKKEKPWYIKYYADEEPIQGITRPKTCGSFEQDHDNDKGDEA
jgi:hypothetical protein